LCTDTQTRRWPGKRLAETDFIRANPRFVAIRLPRMPAHRDIQRRMNQD
jgi:hypothetical protein